MSTKGNFKSEENHIEDWLAIVIQIWKIFFITVKILFHQAQKGTRKEKQPRHTNSKTNNKKGIWK